MRTLKGQNLRIFAGTGASATTIAMATNCTITLTGNTEDGNNKDVLGLAARPEIVSRGWSVSSDSLDVGDIGTLLAAIKSQTPFTVAWDETSTSDNRTPQNASFGYEGKAFISDLTVNFNDRENATKTIQLTGSGPLTASSHLSAGTVPSLFYTKGQNVRLFLSSDLTMEAATYVIAAAKNLTLHVACQTEQSSTKDTDGDWTVMEVTGISFDITSEALVRSGDTITSQVEAHGLADLEGNFVDGVDTVVSFKIANVDGANNRTAGTTIMSGSVTITSLTINAPSRANATYSVVLSGYGPYTAGS